MRNKKLLNKKVQIKEPISFLEIKYHGLIGTVVDSYDNKLLVQFPNKVKLRIDKNNLIFHDEK